MKDFIPFDTVLEDDRVILRTLLPDDLAHLRSYVFSEPDLWKYSFVGINDEADMQQYIEAAVTQSEQGSSFAFIVYDKLKNTYAGCTRYYDIQPQFKSLQVGYTWYGKEFQGTGLNRHCKYLLLDFAFSQLGIERVEFRADSRNDRSVAAMKAIGCTVEGTLRSHLPLPDGTRRDSIVLSILKSEWNDTHKDRLSRQLYSI